MVAPLQVRPSYLYHESSRYNSTSRRTVCLWAWSSFTLLVLAGIDYCAAPAEALQQPDIRVDVSLVRAPFIAADSSGRTLRNISREELTVTDDGSRQDIKYLWTEMDLPLTVGLAIDISSSEGRYVRVHRDSAMRFITRIIGPSDRAFLATVDEQPRLLSDLTSSTDHSCPKQQLPKRMHQLAVS